MRTLGATMTAGILLAGCAVSDNNTYSRADVGRIIETSEGRILSWRPITVKSENGPLGTAAGGAAGGVIGNTIGAGSGNTLATVAGVLVGAGIGYLTEEALRSNTGVEYIVEMEDGRHVTLVQNGDPEEAIPAGSRVLVQYGYDYTRITQI
ncbi:MAG: glycine zipper 2TM domain-containing protein [Pseudomonadota bacterium]